MSNSSQQREAHEWFSKHAADWHAQAQGSDGDVLNTLRQRYDYVLQVIANTDRVDRLLDLGCGSGDLTVLAAGRVGECVGIDSSSEMIGLARALAEKEGAGNCRFEVGSVLDADASPQPFDMAVALGLIEYFDADELAAFLAQLRHTVRPGGQIVVESRNRLFNLLSLNDFTRMELSLGTIDRLYAEALALTSAKDIAEAIELLRDADRSMPFPEEYPLTGVPVRNRHQYTPGALVQILAAAGFEAEGISGYHYHGLIPRTKGTHPALHALISSEAQRHIVERPEALPNCSSFMVRARHVGKT